ncbi:MAG: hypothetical protein E7576_04400 [Ruminococcaceae bacterium]|jgi:1-acyl-sn-glycerol-3-phosphate acyltransferase|nr:hypothetical protein [Oscillospiraceae bacterium]
MKIKVKETTLAEALAEPRAVHRPPVKPSPFFRWLLKTVSAPDLKATDFTAEKIGMEKLGRDEPCLYLMNHSSFIDLKIAATLIYPRPFNIVCTSDGFVGKEGLMRAIGCIPTAKFVPDLTLIRDLNTAFRDNRCSVLMYPEASYTFDGCATPLPDSLGGALKRFGVPVVMIRTYGAFARDPLYNNLQLRNVKVSARMEYLLSPEDLKNRTAEELNGILKEQFTFDNFRWQQENRVKIDEPFRADGLNRVLYKCPRCKTEGKTAGRGTELVCEACGKRWELDEYGCLTSADGDPVFDHVPDWYNWERACVREELERGTYRLEVPVTVCVMTNMKHICRVGEGILRHDADGFALDACRGELSYRQPPLASYGLYADYYWYEIGDMICVGDNRILYYCFPTDGRDVVAKTRIAAEELYKIKRAEKRAGQKNRI